MTQSGFVPTADGGRLYFESHGAGSNAIVVPFAAALAESMKPLARGRRLVTYDMRGRGRSDPLPDPAGAGFEADLADLDAVRAHLELDRISLLGFSYLGAVTSTYAARHPDRIDRLVLLGAIGPAPETVGPRPSPDLSGLDQAGLAALQSSFADRGQTEEFCDAYWRAYLPLFAAPGAGAAAALDRLVAMCPLENERPGAFLSVLAPITRDLATHDHRAVGRAIRAPTLIVHGDADRVAPLENARAWTGVIADSRLVVIPNVGHLLWAEAPDLVLDPIDRFLPSDSLVV